MQEGEPEEHVFPADGSPVRTRYRLADGKLEGELLQYDDDNRLAAKLTYRAGVMHGPAEFYEGGKLQLRTHFENGVEQGERTLFAGEMPSMKGHCRNGKLEGEATWLRPGGGVQRVAHYANGMLEGESIEYDERGRITHEKLLEAIRTKKALDDKLEGELLMYGANGKVRQKLMFKAGVQQK